MKHTAPALSASVDALSDIDYDFLRQLIYRHSRINLGPDKRALVSGRVARRLRVLKFATYHDYCRWLRTAAGAGEVTELVDAVSTNHTRFFREEKHFDWLRSTLLPSWQAAHPQGEPFRVWSAAGSSGEEPYTLAIVLAEFFGLDGNWTIEATDISTRVIVRAEQGIYEAEKLAPVPEELLRRYFQRGVNEWDGSFRVRAALRRHVRFHRLNLIHPQCPFPRPFHLIFCRNVMIYFDRPTQETLVGKLTAQLEPGGHLMVGHSESLGGIRHTLRQVQAAIYRKTGK